jgi:nucleotide-binding universal stress UspA family protein
MKINIKRILVPTDFSEISFTALDYAAMVAKKFNAKITLLHVYENAEHQSAPGQLVDIKVLIQRGLAEKMQHIINTNPTYLAVKIEPLIIEGKSYREILSAAEKVNADLIVMGTHGSAGLKNLGKYVLGTNAFRTVHESPCPVITIRKGAKKAVCTNILLPLSVDKETGEKVDYAIEWAKTFNAKIHVLAVTEMIDEFVADVQKLNDLVADTEQKLRKEKIDFTSKTFRNSTLSKTIFAHAKKMQCDLIFIMSKNDSGIGEFFVPAADRKIIGESEINVFNMRPIDKK